MQTKPSQGKNTAKATPGQGAGTAYSKAETIAGHALQVMHEELCHKVSVSQE